MHQHKPHSRVNPAVVRRVMLGAMVASAIGATPAVAAVGPDGVRAGNNITVFHNLDFVASFGSASGSQVQVDVFRGASRIATARGAAVDTPEGGALEVNHGPEGAPLPGDCWDGATPDIRPGDRIRVTNPGGAAGVDDAIVDNIRFSGPQTINQVNPATGNLVIDGTLPAPHVDDDNDAATDAANDDADAANPDPQPTRDARVDSGDPTQEVLDERTEVWLEGIAQYIDGNGVATPIPVEALDSAGFLADDDNQVRGAPNVVDNPAGDGTFRMRYFDANGAPNGGLNFERNRPGWSDAELMDAVGADDGHGTGFGHVEILPPVSMLVDGIADVTGPALGCEAASAEAESLGTVSTDTINIASLDPAAADPALTVGGWVADATTAADIVLTDGTNEVVKAATVTTTFDGAKGVSADFTKAEVAGLNQGELTAELRVGGTAAGATKTVAHDTVAPTFGVSLPAGTYTGPQQLAITGATDPVTYTVDGGQSRTYNGVAIELGTGGHTVVITSRDAAGNETVQTLNYGIDAPAPAQQQGGSSGGGSAGGSQAAVQQAPAPAPAVGASRNAPRPIATLLTTTKRVSSAKAKKSGLAARFSAPAGSRSAVVRVYRSKSGRLTLVGKRTVTVKSGSNRVALKGRKMRRKLTAGLYVIEVTLRGADRKGGEPTTTFVRITR